MSLTRSRVLLDLVNGSARSITRRFTNAMHMEGTGLVTELRMSEERWRDMGSPEQITVTIVPGEHMEVETEERPGQLLIDVEPGVGGTRVDPMGPGGYSSQPWGK